jgi:Periplasmic protease
LLRGARNIVVQHPDGNTTKITLPSDIDQQLFEVGALPAFTLRSKSLKVAEVTKNSPALQAGFQAKDHVYEVNGMPIQYYDEFQAILFANKNKVVDIKVAQRGNAKDTITREVKVKSNGTIGTITNSEFIDRKALSEKNTGLHKALVLA